MNFKPMHIIAGPDGRELVDCYSLKVPEYLVIQGIMFVAFKVKRKWPGLDLILT